MLECIKDKGRIVYYIDGKRVNKLTALAYAKSNNKKLPTVMRKGLRIFEKTDNTVVEELKTLKNEIKDKEIEKEKLLSEINKLKEENENMKKEIEKLKSEKDTRQEVLNNKSFSQESSTSNIKNEKYENKYNENEYPGSSSDKDETTDNYSSGSEYSSESEDENDFYKEIKNDLLDVQSMLHDKINDTKNDKIEFEKVYNKNDKEDVLVLENMSLIMKKCKKTLSIVKDSIDNIDKYKEKELKNILKTSIEILEQFK